MEELVRYAFSVSNGATETTTLLWVQVVDNHRGNLCGSMSYPIPAGR